jgi:hypothetical protein
VACATESCCDPKKKELKCVQFYGSTTRLESWRATRKYARQPIPDEFRQAAAEMTERYSLSLVRRILKLDPWRLKKPSAKKLNRAHHKPQTAFFTLPPEAVFPGPRPSAPPFTASCRLVVERPDGARLTLTIPSLDMASINQLCADFLRL